MLRIRGLLTVILIGCTLAARGFANDIRYTVTDLGVLSGAPPGGGSHPTALNDFGQVAGFGDIYTRYSHAFLYDGNGPLINLGSFGGDDSVSIATSINNSGAVVGYSGSGSVTRAFLWTQSGGMQDLPLFPAGQSVAKDINNLGQILGQAKAADGTVHNFIYSPSAPLRELDLRYTPQLINDADVVVATSGSYPDQRTLVSSGGTGSWLNIGSLGGTETFPDRIDAWGDIVGYSTTDLSGTQSLAFLFSGGTMTNLGSFGGTVSEANAVNDFGTIVGGASYPGNTVGAACVWYGGGPIEDLNDLIDPALKWTLDGASDVNNSGQIAVEGYQPNGPHHALLLTPIPEPSSSHMLCAIGSLFLLAKAGAAYGSGADSILRHVFASTFNFQEGSIMFKLRWLKDVPAQIWAIAGMLRGKRKGRFLHRVVKRFRREAAIFRPLRFENVEPRRLLTSTVLIWSPPITDTSPVWTTAAVDPLRKDWLVQNPDGSYSQTYWTNGSEADLPAVTGTSLANPAVVTLSSTATDRVFASSIKFLGTTIDNVASSSYYDIQPRPGQNDKIQLDSGGTTVETDLGGYGLTTVANFSAGVVPNASGPNTLTAQTGAGTVAIVNGYTSVSQISVVDAGTLEIGSNATVFAQSATVWYGALDVRGSLNLTDNDAGLAITAGGTIAGTGIINLGQATALTYDSVAHSYFDGHIAGSTGSLEVDAGKLTLSNNSGYTGTTRLYGGTLQLSTVNDCLPVTTTIDFGDSGSGGDLDLNGTNQAVGGLAGASLYATVENSKSGVTPSTFTFTGSATPSATFDGSLADHITSGGTLALEVSGGTLTLTAYNAYTGGTSVVGGTLIMGSKYALGQDPNSSLLVTGAGILDLNGQGSFDNYGTYGKYEVSVGSLNGNGTIENGESGTTPPPCMLDIWLSDPDDNANPIQSYFAGVIKDGTGTMALYVPEEGTLSLAGINTYTGGTWMEDSARLTLGDGVTNGAIRGIVTYGDQVVNQSPLTIERRGNDRAGPQLDDCRRLLLGKDRSGTGKVGQHRWTQLVYERDTRGGGRDPTGQRPLAAGQFGRDRGWRRNRPQRAFGNADERDSGQRVDRQRRHGWRPFRKRFLHILQGHGQRGARRRGGATEGTHDRPRPWDGNAFRRECLRQQHRSRRRHTVVGKRRRFAQRHEPHDQRRDLAPQRPLDQYAGHGRLGERGRGRFRACFQRNAQREFGLQSL